MTDEPDGFGEWPGADEVATIGGPVRPIRTDGGDDVDGAGDLPGDVDELPSALRRRVEITLAADEPIEAFLAAAWRRFRDAPAAETLADAVRFEVDRRERDLDTVRLAPEVELPRETWERIWYRYLDHLHNLRGTDAETPDVGDYVNEYVTLAPTLVVPADPDADPPLEELVVRMGEWPVVPRRRDGEPLEPAPDEAEEGEEAEETDER